MSRNFTSDQELTDRLYFSDKEAFDELYHRYWFSLYNYSLKKINDPDEAQKVVRDLFVDLWTKRETWPLDFSVSQFFYSEIRKAVVRTINQKLLEQKNIDEELILDFSTEALLQAKLPVRNQYTATAETIASRRIPSLSISGMKWFLQGLVAKLN